jgi:glycerol-3-phosphate acyltransferase PlsX
MSADVDVVVTDGFTGNVALKTLEGGLAGMVRTLEDMALGDPVVLAAAARLGQTLNPEATGGALLLGVRGVSIISHGSSSAWAITNAIQVAREMVQVGVVDALSAQVAGRGKAEPADRFL